MEVSGVACTEQRRIKDKGPKGHRVWSLHLQGTFCQHSHPLLLGEQPGADLQYGKMAKYLKMLTLTHSLYF